MQLDELEASLTAAQPPPGLSPALRALWLEARGDWEAAHELANEAGGPDGAWVHAYLHRKEGDADNARYWYRQAGRAACDGPLQREWREIAAALLGG